MQKKLLLAFFLCVGALLSAQSLRPVDLVKDSKQSGQQFESASLFSDANQKRRAVTELNEHSTTYDVLDVQLEQLAGLRQKSPNSLRLTLPGQGRADIELELVQVDIFATDFLVTESPAEIEVEVDLGVHYRGVIKGDDRSLVAISIFENEVMGIIANDDGNLVLGKLKGDSWTNEHILYEDAAILAELGSGCEMPDDDYSYTKEELTWEGATDKALTDCVQIYYEADYDVFQDKGSTAATTSFVTGMHNQVATLYANEQINTELSQVVVWSSSSPYSSTSSSGMLSDFQAYRNGFNGDLAALLSYQASGGIAAGFSGICNSNPDNSMCFNSINSTYSTVPTYSWTIDLVTHELGHLFGSRHTHACVWNGNNTAIDGCSGSTEGSCALPGNPPGGGTIMSYCHFNVGKDFNLGFGTQPGNVIRNKVQNGSCLQACGGGGGGGGGCDDNAATLSITFDNYPEETSWTITNSGGSTVASGGTYGSQADGSTLNIDLCLADGCYTFTINDSYGDGICCGYGNGSYTLSDGSGTLASGGSFASSESTNFCVGSGGGGGNDCITIDFNTNTVGSYGGSQDNGTATVLDGGASVRLQNNAWKSISLNYTVTPNTVIELNFGSTSQGEIHGIGFDSDNSISDNRTFRLYGTQNWGISNYDTYSNVGYYTAFTIPVGQFYTGSFDRLFFVMDQDSGSGGNAYFNDVRIYEGSSCGQPSGDGRIILGAEMMEAPTALRAFPNPATDIVHLQFGATTFGEGQIMLYNMTGQQMLTQKLQLAQGVNTSQLSVADLPVGTYIVRLQTDAGEQTTRISVIR